MACKPTNLPNGLKVGGCLQVENGTLVSVYPFVAEPDANFQVVQGVGIVNCDGTFNVTLIDEADVINSGLVSITSTNGTITVLADVTINGTATMTTGVTGDFYRSRGEWWRT